MYVANVHFNYFDLWIQVHGLELEHLSGSYARILVGLNILLITYFCPMLRLSHLYILALLNGYIHFKK